MKAPYILQSAIEKLPALLGLVAVAMTWIHPEAALAASLQTSGNNALIFEVKQNSEELIRPKQTFLTMTDIQHSDPKFHYQNLLKEFLVSKKSPMADCVEILVSLDTHGKILALSAAESSYGVRTIVGSENYWGVMAGHTLKKMGNSPCEAVVNMDKFLREYPRRSAIKYSDMSFVDMCGLYKQPCPGKAAHHWVKNNLGVTNRLAEFQKQAETLAFDYRITLASAQ